MEVVDLQTPSSIPQINLPQQLITSEILVRLPIKSLIRFKSVSKDWKSIISSPQFANLHLHFQRSSPNYSPKLLFLLTETGEPISWYDRNFWFWVFDYSAYEEGRNHLYQIDRFHEGPNDTSNFYVWGCSDGLVLLATGLCDSCCYIWNPATHESRKFLCPSSFSNHKSWRAWGFGYVSSVDDYKIVCLSFKSEFGIDDNCESHAFTLSMKSGAWKQVGCDHGVYLDWGYYKSGVLVDEMIYWVLRNSFLKVCIVGFDLASEEFIELDPPEWRRENGKGCSLSVVEGCLCFCSFDYYSGELDISMLKEHGGSTSWVKFYRFCHGFDMNFDFLNVSGVWSGKFIMCTSKKSAVFVDMNRDPPVMTVFITSRGLVHRPEHVEYYVKSLVSPFGLVDSDTKI